MALLAVGEGMIGVLSTALDGLVPAPWPTDSELGRGVVSLRLTDATFPPRRCAMTPRLQARIPKCFGWEFLPGAEILVWCNANYSPQAGAIDWLVEQLGDFDAAFFAHPVRATVGEELDFLAAHGDSHYLRGRYTHEQVGPWPRNGWLPNGAVFAYRPTASMRAALTDWFLAMARYHLNDQLSLAACFERHLDNYREVVRLAALPSLGVPFVFHPKVKP